MYFLPKNNWLYSFLVNLSTPVKYTLTLLLAIIFLIIWFIVFYSKLANYEIALSLEIKNLRKKEKILEQIKKDINFILNEIQNVQNEIDLIINSYVSEKENNNSDVLIKNAKLLNLIVSSLDYENYIVRSSYIKNIVRFNFKGEFSQIVEFFKLLALSSDWIKFKKINISAELNKKIKVESVLKFYSPKEDFKCLSKELSLSI